MRDIKNTLLTFPDGFTYLNVAFCQNPSGGYLLYPRRVRKTGKTYAAESSIGFAHLAEKSASVQMISNHYLVPHGKAVIGLEDPRAISFKGRRLLFCNELISNERECYPRPSLYEIINGRGHWVASANNFLEKKICKSFLPIAPDLAVVRPWLPLSGRDDRSIWLVRLTQPNSLTNCFECEPVEVLIPVEPGFAVFGISTVAVIGGFTFLFWHKVTSLKKEEKEYLHFVSALDKHGHEIARTKDPFLTLKDFPEPSDPWVRGALYFTNIVVEEKANMYSAIVTVGDNINYLHQGNLGNLIDNLE